MIPIPGKIYGVLAGVAAAVALAGGAYHKGVVSERGRQALQQVETLKQAMKTKDALQARNNAIVAGHAAKTQKREVIYRTITREVAAHAASTPAVLCIDSVGMRIIGAAARGELPNSAAQPDSGVP